MKNTQEWLDTAKNLKAGRSKRVVCCGKDRSAVISHASKGYTYRCFRCGANHFVRHGERSTAEILKHRKELKEYLQGAEGVDLPNDFTYDLPDEALLWFLKAGVSSEVVRHYGFGYSDSLGRAVLPVYVQDELRMTVSRALYKGQKPKYMNKKDNDPSSVFFASDPALQMTDLQGTVLTEDILSAVRVGAVVRAVSTLGTSLAPKLAVRLLKQFCTPFYVWYDGDEAGVRGARKVIKTLSLLGAECYNIESDKDPKEYNNDGIRRFIRTVHGYRDCT